ncbi:hypothetical protein [Priestia taiwanensis]|uniref:Uncharacterized protein n=1 Tax=Priestia taiwanensis TaxID=1347902 RepID=A0A917AL19_9BACI|nr:hypothetical protein [Priestia taiwanensis]MBM7361922.1 hypothetical protein [Priestia taiwanensis]GGE58025.1 hypothetical protein GCM10007140_05490 [Priestia taiwanensis]
MKKILKFGVWFIILIAAKSSINYAIGGPIIETADFIQLAIVALGLALLDLNKLQPAHARLK